MPTTYSNCLYAAAGGLITYGTSQFDACRQSGAKPADLPVIQPTKFELIINRKTAKTLGLTIPDKLLVFADEVIE
jgi:ABC-type uncharacterized transport system substrate-binding protein